MTEHTPGPWHLSLDRNGRDVYTDHGSPWLFGPDGKPVIDFQQADYDSEAWYKFKDADARLIAAAPDLLAACAAALAYSENGEGAGWRVAEMARAAIAKARGGEK